MLRVLRITLLLLFSFLIQTAYSISTFDLETVKNFVSSQNEIRVLIGKAPGNGHQSASLTVMRKLRQLGFEGRFTVVYTDDIGSGLRRIVTELDFPNQADQIIHKYGARFISLTKYLELGDTLENSSEVFTISGALDNPYSFSLIHKSYGDFNIFEKSPTLVLAPDNWDGTQRIYYNGSSIDLDLDIGIRLQHFPVFPNVNQDELPKFLKESMVGNGQESKVRGVEEILRASMSDTHFVQPVYGVGFKGSHFIMNNLKVLQALQGPDAEPNSLQQKGIVLSVLSNLSDSEIEGIREYITASGLDSDRMTFSHVTDPNFSKHLEQTQAGRILFAQVGNLPQEVFELFYRLGNLPGTVAGVNGESLVKIIGRPYIITDSTYNQIRDIISGSLDQDSLLSNRFKTQALLIANKFEDRTTYSLLAFVRQLSLFNPESSSIIRFAKSLVGHTASCELLTKTALSSSD